MTYSPVPIEKMVPSYKDQVWGEEILLAETPIYTLKGLHYKAGKAGGLQYHVEKDESFYLAKGEAFVDFDRGDGKLERVPMSSGDTFHVPPGAVHRFEAVTDCTVFEASTPHKDDRVRMEEHYGVPVIGDAYGLPTTRAVG